VDADEQEWLERLVLASGSAIDNLRGVDDPTVARLLADVEGFQARLLQRLAERPGQARRDG
jgi:hypothetical protein